jgi:hypothetical protein
VEKISEHIVCPWFVRLLGGLTALAIKDDLIVCGCATGDILFLDTQRIFNKYTVKARILKKIHSIAISESHEIFVGYIGGVLLFDNMGFLKWDMKANLGYLVNSLDYCNNFFGVCFPHEIRVYDQYCKLFWKKSGGILGPFFNRLVLTNRYVAVSRIHGAGSAWGEVMLLDLEGHDIWQQETGNVSALDLTDKYLVAGTQGKVILFTVEGFRTEIPISFLARHIPFLSIFSYNAPRCIKIFQDTVAFGTQSGEINAHSLPEGDLIWKFETKGSINSIDINKKYLLAGCSQGSYLFDIKTGKCIWKYNAVNATQVCLGKKYFAIGGGNKVHIFGF